MNELAYNTNLNIRNSLDYLADHNLELWRKLVAKIQTMMMVVSKELKK